MTEAHGLAWRVTETFGLKLTLRSAEGDVCFTMTTQQATYFLAAANRTMATVLLGPGFSWPGETPMEG